MDVSKYVAIAKVIGEFDTAKAEAPTSLVDSRSGTIIVIRGVPQTSLLHDLAEKLNLDADCILEHYGFPNSFRIRPLPSRPLSVANIRFISLGVYISSSSLEHRTNDLRSKLKEQLQDHYRECLSDNRFGIERCRSISVHGNNFFTIEQQATLFTYGDFHSQKSWSGVLLTDCGRVSSSPPWIPRFLSGIDAHFYPLTPSGRCSLSPASFPTSARDTRDSRKYNHPDPFSFRAVTDNRTMSPNDRGLCATNPLIFLCDMLDTSALSWLHVLSYLRASYEYLPVSPTEQAPRLRADKELLDRGICYFTDTINFLKHPPENWPYADRSQAISARVITDFQSLCSEAKSLSEWCSESISIAMSTINILDSQKSLAEARRVQLITYLAFIFIPMTFIASCFGMNIQELAEPGSSLRTYFTISIPFTISMLLIPAWIETKVQIQQQIRNLRLRLA
ncbi:MAG: hypothetical protein LQ351_002876 [Letrouitia transgressa]|nr:MAG: hypothetical protein LQ351_002876 [Letrouitia transgressa]